MICAMRPPACGAMATASASLPMWINSPGGSGCCATSSVALLAIRVQREDAAILVVAQFGDLHRAQMSDTIGKQRIVVVQPPLAIERHDGMVRGPAHHRCEDDASPCVWAIHVVGGRVAEPVSVAGGIRQVVLAAILV